MGEVIEPHGLLASWFLTWFTHEFPDFQDLLAVFDFELVEVQSPVAPVYIAAALLLGVKDRMIGWDGGDVFELVVFVRNLPQTCVASRVIDCARSLLKCVPPRRLITLHPQLQMHRRHDGWLRRRRVLSSVLGAEMWMLLILLHLLYHVLAATVWPSLRHY